MITEGKFRQFLQANVDEFLRRAPVIVEKALAARQAHLTHYRTRQSFSSQIRAVLTNKATALRESDPVLWDRYVGSLQHPALEDAAVMTGFYMADVLTDETARAGECPPNDTVVAITKQYENTLLDYRLQLIAQDASLGKRKSRVAFS